MQAIKKVLSVIICIALMLTTIVVPSASVAFAANITGTVITESTSLRVRSLPSTSSNTIGWVEKGSTVTITDHTSYSGWYQINYNGSVGYVSADYVRINPIAPEYTPDADFEAYLTSQNFPESYKDGLRNLHAAHPNWIFVAQDTGLNWADAVAGESMLRRSLVQKLSYYPDAFYSYQQGAYNPDTGTHVVFDGSNWIQASKELIEHCLDPRNYLSETYIYSFLNLSYSSTETVENISQILKDSFMAGAYPAQFEQIDNYATYADAFLAAAQASNVSAYHLASRCKQEQGIYGSALSRGDVEGYPNCFNFFNINAYNTSDASNVVNGAKYAQSQSWNTPYASIVGGAKWIAKGYISKGQDTLYLQKFDLVGPSYYTNQYMTNIQAVFSESSILKNGISEDIANSNLLFKIPVYRNMPASACPKPTGSGANNYLLNSLTVEGYSIPFSTYECNYELVVGNEVASVAINATPADPNATVTGTGVIPLNFGTNTVTITVTAPSGTKCYYTIVISRQFSGGDDPYAPSINSSKYTFATYIVGIEPQTPVGDFIANLGITNGSAEVKDANGNARTAGSVCSGDKVIIYKADGSVCFEYYLSIYGDINADGKITTVDLFMGQRHILSTYSLSGARLYAADINKDNKLTTVDLFMGQRHILGTYTITQ